MTIVEKTEPAASWLGRNGMTSGEEPLAIPPIKDVGFPYRSSRQFGAARRRDRRRAAAVQLAALRDRSAQRVRGLGQLAARRRSCHRDYGTYLGWVLERATEGVSTSHGRVSAVASARSRDALGDRGRASAASEGDPSRHRGRALVLTGPGRPPRTSRTTRRRRVARLPLRQPPRRVRPDARRRGGRDRRSSAAARAPSARSSSCATCRPRARIAVYTPTLPLSRGESFLENRVFADPDDVGWEHLDLRDPARLRQALRPRRLRHGRARLDRRRRPVLAS